MKSTGKISIFIYLFVYLLMVQNIKAIMTSPQPAQLINIKAVKKPELTPTVSSLLAQPPINLDENTRIHLKAFHKEVEKLHLLYPENFVSCFPSQEKKIALTFDDGPDSSTTRKVLDILEYYNINATFFVIGQNIDKYRDVIYRAVKSQHEVANHSWSHIRPTSISTQELVNDIEKTRKKLHDLGINTKVFRPPYGLVTQQQMDMLKALDYKVVIWSIDSMDWYTNNPQEIVQCVLQTVHPGAIILMHCAGGPENRQATLEALPLIISALKRKGYQFVTVKELLNY